MKKIFALLAVVLAVVSCQKEINGLPVDSNNEAAVSLSVALPDDATRAVGADSALGGISNYDKNLYDIRFILEVYDAQGKLAKDRMVKAEGDATSATFNFRLIPGRNYKFVVWADFVANGANCDLHYDTSAGLRNVKVVNARWTAIDETRDAYTAAVDVVNYSGSTLIPNIVLTRPFAKLRVVTNDIKEMISVRPAIVKVNYFDTKFYTAFDAFAEEPIDQSYDGHELVVNLANGDDVDTYDGEDPEENGEQTLFADYMFAKQGDRVKFTMDVEDNGGIELPQVVFSTDIPVNRNHLTTVYGPILTDANNITVEIKPEFDNGSNWNPGNDKYDVEIWDGKSMAEPNKDANGNYIIKTPSELAWLAAAVNGTLNEEYTRATVDANDFSGKTFILSQDIDLGNEPWTPIGSNGKIFKGTFDGNNKKIANLVVNGYNNNAGLFGHTTDGEIKNLVIENAKVSGRLNVGVVAGTPYTSKYTNITIKGHVEVNGMAYVGGVGGKNAYANWENITVNVDKTSYVKANSIENDTAYRTYVGGVVGFNGEGGHSFKNITSNINVEGSTCDVGGLFGIAHYGNKFENCSCSGNVEIYSAEEAEEAEEIGGIAGVWNNGGADVVFTNCSFTGTLTTNIDVDFYYGGLIGKPYSETGTGKLIIDGYEMVANGVGLKDGEYYIQSVAGLKWLAEQVNGGNNFSNKVVKLATDLDLNNEEWTPIGNSTYSFQGTFDGQNKTISNLVITGNKSNVGLFGFTTNGEIKNLVVENAEVSGYLNVAVVAGTPYTSKYTNITVQGHVEINGFAYVGAVGGKNAYADWTNVTVNVDETSYVNANSIEGSTAYRTYVGGVCGFNGEGSHSFTNITSNIDVKGSTIDVGGLFGIAHYGNKFENCSCSGDVEIYAAEEAEEAQEIGGIAGVWHNENDKTVTMTNCTFTGKLKTNIADVDFYYGGLVGKPYSETGTGILWLNGNKCLANGIIEDENGNLVVNSLDSLEEALKTAGAAGAGDTTIVFAENTNINMTNAEWTPIKVDGYNGADIVTIEGNGAVITGLEAPLFAGGFAGGSGIVIKNLTITNSNIVSANTQGSGAFIECVDSMDVITLDNCHFTNSTLSGSRTGGLIGWTSGYSNVNDGPVKLYVTIKNCSVIDVDINATGSAAAINGHAGASDWTYTTIENCTVKDCNINSTDSGSWRTGVVVGTANVGEVTISNITESGNTLTQTGKTAPVGFLRNLYGRAVLGTTGKLTIDGYKYVAEGLFEDANGNAVVGNQTALADALAAGKTNVTLTAGNYELSGLNFVANNVTLKGVDKANVVLNLEKSIYLQNKSVTLENLTYNLNAGKDYTEQAFAFVHHATAFNLKNCNVNRLRLNVYEANIEGCTFTLNTSSGFDGYCIYYYGNDNSTVNVKNSTFATAGKGICIYSEHAKAYNLNVDKCSFTSSDSATDKAAIQMHTELGISGNVKITETTATGFANINGGLWNELNNNTKVATDKFDIWVDGTQVH